MHQVAAYNCHDGLCLVELLKQQVNFLDLELESVVGDASIVVDVLNDQGYYLKS